MLELVRWRKVKVKVTQSCLTLCDPMDYTVHRILQTRILEWVAFPFCRASSQPRDQTQVSCIAGGFFTSHSLLLLFFNIILQKGSTFLCLSEFSKIYANPPHPALFSTNFPKGDLLFPLCVSSFYFPITTLTP